MAVEYSAPQAYYIVKARCSKKSKRRKDAKKINETIIEEDPSNKNRPLFALQVDERSRVFVMDMVPKVAEFLEVGTVDLITEEVKTYLTRLHGGPEIGINIRLKYNKNLDCPVLESSFAILDHNERNASFTSILIYALTGNLQDILQVLLRAEIPNVELQFVDDKYIAEVKEFLSNSPHLRKLCIGNHYLKKDQHLVHDIMKSSKSLSTLHFSRKNMSWSQRNQVCNKSLNDYMRYIFEIKSLERLDLIQITGLFTDHVESLAEGLLDMKSSKLKILDISAKRRYNSTKPTDITKLVRALRHIDTVEEFNVSRRMLSGYESVIECAKLLKRSKCLKKLDLFASQYSNNCRIHPDAWTYMGKALPRTDSLQNLDISFHRLSEASWKALGEGLKVNTSLLTLKAWKRCDLRYDKETNILLPVFDALHENRTLESLSLNGYDLSDSITALEVLESALIQNTSLKSLQIEESAMTDEGVAILSRSLPQMKSIEELDLEHHGCSLNGAQAFAKGIKNNYNLLSVGLGTRCRLHRSMYGTPIEAEGFAKEWHEVQYYARMNRRGRRCIGSKSPIQPPLWPLVLANAMKKEEQDPSEFIGEGDVREKDLFAGDYDTSIDALFFLLRDAMALMPVPS